ncbi:unnamed protein product, partial [Brenthis ino]
MKAFVCIVLFAAVALAAPEGKRDKRGYLHGGFSSGYDFGHSSFDHSSLDFGLSHGAIVEPVYHAPAAKIISVNKVVEVPRVVEVKKIISVPKVVSVPKIVKVSKIVEEPHFGHFSSGWW